MPDTKKKYSSYRRTIEINSINQSTQILFRNEQQRRLEEERNERLVLENEKEKLQNDYIEIIKQIEHETREEKENCTKSLLKNQNHIQDMNLKAKSDVAIINKKIAS